MDYPTRPVNCRFSGGSALNSQASDNDWVLNKKYMASDISEEHMFEGRQETCGKDCCGYCDYYTKEGGEYEGHVSTRQTAVIKADKKNASSYKFATRVSSQIERHPYQESHVQSLTSHGFGSSLIACLPPISIWKTYKSHSRHSVTLIYNHTVQCLSATIFPFNPSVSLSSVLLSSPSCTIPKVPGVSSRRVPKAYLLSAIYYSWALNNGSPSANSRNHSVRCGVNSSQYEETRTDLLP